MVINSAANTISVARLPVGTEAGTVAAGNHQHSNLLGVIYTRWGRSDCPPSATLVYDGYAAGKSHNQSGSGANPLCLTKNPTWLTADDGNQEGALLYGVEYETVGFGLAKDPVFGALHDQDALCAVCMANDAHMVFMHPGSIDCPAGWTKQYDGYLMGAHFQHNASEFVCVDRNAEGRVGGAANQNGYLWFPTEAECSSLPCGPYVHNRELTCSICTR